jgi:ABC-type metal ion transport system substrate-binding protein
MDDEASLIENPRNLKIIELDPAQTYRSPDDVALALVNDGLAALHGQAGEEGRSAA